ncbi:Histone-fold protein [Purpureocillium lavendulum]|uniref:Histone-fold protein n=1 Tax=Purpureocillium lavendulum TaxID=1247861 RepID=A0AB34FNI1_9HYPO|nr:Histone-fold protein [Purpureocillium lavendulum]
MNDSGHSSRESAIPDVHRFDQRVTDSDIMNPAQGQQGQPQGQPGAGAQQQQQPPRPPMYQPQQIRSLPLLSEEEKTKYEQGLRGLWNKANSSPAGSPDQNAARMKIIEFSRMLITKIQQRRLNNQQQQQQQQQAQPGQQQPGQQQPGQTPVRPPSIPQQQQQQQRPQPPQAQQAQQPQGQAQGQAAQQQQQQPPAQQPQQQQKKLEQAATSAANAAQGEGAPASASGPASNAAAPANAAPAPAQRLKFPDHILQHMNKLTIRTPMSLAGKSPPEIAKWTEEMRERYGRALWTMENAKGKIAGIDKHIKDRAASPNPLKEEDLRQLNQRKEQQVKLYGEALKWVENFRKSQEALQPNAQQGGQTGASGTAPVTSAQPGAGAPATPANAAPARPQPPNQGAAGTPVNAALEAAKNQQQMSAANRASPANGTPAPQQAQGQPRPTPPNAAQPTQPPPQAQPQAQKTEQAHPPPVNTALASTMAAQAQAQAQASGAQQQGAARVQTPQSSTPVTAAGPTRALSHSAAMSLANQRAAGSTPGSAPVQGQQPGAGTPTSGTGPLNASAVQQQGHPHAHPTQQTGIQAKMPIPKQLPEKATAVPQGVSLGGGVSAGRPTMSQGTGTLGGVMNQPPVARIPAYNHDAEGDHVLSKKKLDELVRQVCGGTGEGQEGNLLAPDVEENILNMADSFVDNVLHSACRNAKERGSKVLEIRDIQLILERTYNIRVPGYSSDELRTVRKVQPSPGWIAKMSAVQAAKVMPGKGEL